MNIAECALGRRCRVDGSVKLHIVMLVLALVAGGVVVFGHASSPVEVAVTPTALTASGAGVYNLKIVTDASPDLSDLNSFVNSVTSAWNSTEEKVWALFYWSHILKRQTPPMVLHGFDVTDPIRNLSDYGYTMCSTTSGMNQSFYEMLGLRHQYWDVCNHTVSQVEYDGKFHMIDTSMSNVVTLDDGVTLASVTEAAADSARLVREHSVYATSANGFLMGSDTGRNLAAAVSPVDGSIASSYSDALCANGLKFRDYYYNWNSGHRYVLNLRDNESYTRHYRPLGTLPTIGSPARKSTLPIRQRRIRSIRRTNLVFVATAVGRSRLAVGWRMDAWSLQLDEYYRRRSRARARRCRTAGDSRLQGASRERHHVPEDRGAIRANRRARDGGHFAEHQSRQVVAPGRDDRHSGRRRRPGHRQPP